MNRADIGMIQGRSCLCFALEAGQGLRILDDGIGQELQGDEAMQAEVLGLVDDPHAATTEFLDNPVMRDGLADHRQERILRRQAMRVNKGGRASRPSRRPMTPASPQIASIDVAAPVDRTFLLQYSSLPQEQKTLERCSAKGNP